MDAIRFEKDQDNIVTLTIDLPNQPVNILNAEFREAFTKICERLAFEKDTISGIIITSAKKTFFAGADLKEIVKIEYKDAEKFFTTITQLKSQFRFIETFGKPVVAAINGSALGGGWEICLACHHRICVNDPSIKLGLPEVTLGVSPGGGGIVRTVRLLGLEKSLPYLLEGKESNPEQALANGLVHELVSDQQELLASAKKWIKAHPQSQQPWDDKAYKIPGGTPNQPKVAQMLSIAPAMLFNKTLGCYPAPEAIMSAAVEGAIVDFDTALKIEGRYFLKLVLSSVAKNMITTFWFGLNAIKAGGSRPKTIEKSLVKKVGILGAGMMGGGIAYACATRGIDTVLKDISLENAEKGKAYSAKILEKRVATKKMRVEKQQEILNRILPTEKVDDLKGCDLIVEAVFEDQALKHRVTQESEPFLTENGIFASNTSTLPITGLATASKKPENFIGLHFFSPVEKMQLVEIIKGKQTSDETLARSFDFVQQIGKIPIVVNDSRGFFTSRVFSTFVYEGVGMLAEGQNSNAIEEAALQAGMPVGPLAVTDEVTLTLLVKIRDQHKKDQETGGVPWLSHPGEKVIDRMVNDFDRRGKAYHAGFYEYPQNGKKYLWPELNKIFGNNHAAISFLDMKDRILFIQAIETVRCLEEGVLMSVQDANIGSIFGIGYPAWTGGALQFINQYGLKKFVLRSEVLAEKYGSRFAPPKLLMQKAERGESFVG